MLVSMAVALQHVKALLEQRNPPNGTQVPKSSATAGALPASMGDTGLFEAGGVSCVKNGDAPDFRLVEGRVS